MNRQLGPERLHAQIRGLVPRAAGSKGFGSDGVAGGGDGGGEEVGFGEEATEFKVLGEKAWCVFGEGGCGCGCCGGRC